MIITEKKLRLHAANGLNLKDYWVWCGSVTRSENRYYMFASRWPHNYPMFEGYLLRSEIILAMATTPQGPYEYQRTVLPVPSVRWDGRMVHNPTVVRYGNRYLLYYIGSTYQGDIEPQGPFLRATLDQAYRQIRIGLAIAEAPDGEWRVLEKPVLEPNPAGWDASIVTNPAPCVLPDGRIYLYYRSNTPDGLRIGLAIADTPEGPYRRYGEQPVMADFDIEDPFVWHNGSGFAMIAKDMTGTLTGELHAGAYFSSCDGIRWQCGGKAYSRTVLDAEGNELNLGCLERPQLLFTTSGEPEYLCAAAADGPGGFRHAAHTWNIVVPWQKSEGEL